MSDQHLLRDNVSLYKEVGGSVQNVTGDGASGYTIEGRNDRGRIRMTNTTIDLGPQLSDVEYDDTPPNTGPRLICGTCGGCASCCCGRSTLTT